jgi:hypothetical protein
MTLANLTNNTQFISSAVNQAIVKPQGFDGIAGFMFDINLRDNIKLECDITDHFIEDNTIINDHIALKPVVITLTGLVGEKILKSERELGILGQTVDKLDAFSTFAPELSIQANRIFNQAQQTANTLKQAEKIAKNIYGLFNDLDVEAEATLQSKAFGFFNALRESRQLFVVSTPWNTFENMAIMSIDATQEDSIHRTSFEIVMKQLRFSKVILTTLNSQGRRADQISPVDNKGRTKGTVTDKSLLAKFFS